MRNRRCRSLLALGSLPFFVLAGATAVASAGRAAGATISNWMISSHAINLINGYTGSGTLTTSAFDVPSTAEIGTRAMGWVTQPTAACTFYGPVSQSSSFLYALKHNKMPAGTVYVMLDMESWALTPHPEQVTPKVYMREFVTTARKHGYKPILAPSVNLTQGMTCAQTSAPAWKNYLVECAVPKIVAQAGPVVYEIQSRLSTNPSGHVSTGQTLYTDTLNTDGSADGYWLNVPEQGTACPNCVPGGAPQVAVSYLELLGYSS